MGCLELKTVEMFLRKFLSIKIVFLISLSCSDNSVSIPYYNSPSFEPVFIPKNQLVDNIVKHKINDFSLTNHNNNKFGSEDLKGKVHVANFIFTSCTNICPKMTTNMRLIEKEFLESTSVNLISFTVTPWIDKPSTLKRYKEEFTLNSSNWHFLTGNKKKIYEIARKNYFAEEELGFTKDSTDFLHTEHFILVDENLRIRGIYNGTLELDVKQLIADINLLKK